MTHLKIRKSEKVYSGRVFDLVVDEIEYPNGERAIREVAEHPGGAVAVPVLEDGTIILIRQYRYPLKEYIYELPAGKLDTGEDPLACAKRELEEETGYQASTMKKLTAIFTTPGFCTEQLHIFLATDIKKLDGGQRLETGEDLSIERIPFTRAVEMIHSGKIVDSKTICGILIAEKTVQT